MEQFLNHMDVLASARGRLLEAQAVVRAGGGGAFRDGTYNADAAQEALDAAQAAVADAERHAVDIQRALETGALVACMGALLLDGCSWGRAGVGCVSSVHGRVAVSWM